MKNCIQLAEKGKYFWIEIGSKDSLTVITPEKDFFGPFLSQGQSLVERVASQEFIAKLANCANGFTYNELGSVFFENNFFKFKLTNFDFKDLLERIYNFTHKYCFLIISCTSGNPCPKEYNRQVWESLAFKTGFFKHPGYYDYLNILDIVQPDEKVLFLPLEKISSSTVSQFGVDFLTKEQMLHMDMLRFSGRRSDAHCIRYVRASKFIRKNDRVLDLACGYGYGSYLVYQNSKARTVLGMDLSQACIRYASELYKGENLSYKVGNAQCLESIKDESIDFILSFETIEHLPSPNLYLKELFRVLSPGGRLFISAPNQWVNEFGVDPNPDHLHVYSWAKLKNELTGEGFIIEKTFNQTAGGALKCPDAMPLFEEIPVEGEEPETSEWICILAMKSPILGRGKRANDRWDLPISDDFNLLAFNRDYSNPFLVSSLVTRGERLSNDKELIKLQKEILSCEEGKNPVDYGSALCGLIYSLLRSKDIGIEPDQLRIKAEKFLKLNDANPHVLRWKISVSYAFGLLCYSFKQYSNALSFWEFTLNQDPARFSPLLTTKILDASLGIALIKMASDPSASLLVLESSLQKSEVLIKSDWLNVSGKTNCPIALGYGEMGEVLDKTSRNAYLLDALKKYPDRPIVIQEQCQGFFERNLFQLKNEIQQLERTNGKLIGEIKKLSDRNIELANECQGLYRKNVELANECQSLSADYSKLKNNNYGKAINSAGQSDLIEENEILKKQINDLHDLFYDLVEEEQQRLEKYSRTNSAKIAKFLFVLKNFKSAGYPSRISVLTAALRSLFFEKAPLAPSFGFYAQSCEFLKAKLNVFDTFYNDERRLGHFDIILQVDNFLTGGLENVVLQQANYFKSQGKKVLILVLKNKGEAFDRAQKEGLEIMQHAYSDSFYRNLLVSSKPRCVLSHCSFSGAKIADSNNIPFVQVVHNLYIWTRTYPEIKKEIINSIPFTTAAIGVSKRVSEFFTEEYGMPRTRSLTILNGVDLGKFNFSRGKRISRRNSLQLSDSDFVLLVSASISYQKNYISLIRAFSLATRSCSNLRLLIVGKVYDKSLFRKIEELIIKENIKDKVSYLGNVENIQEYYFAADALIQASFYEGCSLSVLEALASSLPVISSEIAVTEEMKKFGKVISVESPVPLESLVMGSLEKRYPHFEHNLSRAIVQFASEPQAKREPTSFERMKGISKEYCFSKYLSFIDAL